MVIDHYVLVKTVNGCCVVSESCALGDYKLVRDVKPGEIILLKNGRWETIFQMRSVKLQKCIFEHIYFMKKDTIANGLHTETLRYNLGSKLALEDDTEFSVEDTVVMAVPRTAIPMAKGYAETIGLEYIQILHKEAKSGRTFIMPSNSERLELCNKIFYLRGDIGDKNIILVDDSLVRGNTIKGIAKLFKKAKSVHIRIASPPVIGRCFYGIDIPTEEELIANEGLEDLDKKLGVSSIKYLTLEGMLSCFGDGFCTECFTKDYAKW